MAVNDQLKVSSDGLYRAGERSVRPEEASAYDPPEIAQGMSPAGDVWSLGVTLVEALTQHPPVQEQSEQEEPVLPNTISRPIVDIVHQCLRRDRWLRWTVADIAARLREISAESLGRTTRAPERMISKRHYVTLAAIISVALALGVVLGPRIVNRRQDAPRSSSILFEQPSAQPESPRSPATSELGRSTTKGTSDEKRVFPGGSPSARPLRPEAKSTPGTSSPGEVVHQVLPDVPVKNEKRHSRHSASQREGPR